MLFSDGSWGEQGTPQEMKRILMTFGQISAAMTIGSAPYNIAKNQQQQQARYGPRRLARSLRAPMTRSREFAPPFPAAPRADMQEWRSPMKVRFPTSAGTLCYCICLLGAVATPAAEYPIAGVAPDRRPEGAPVTQEVTKEPGWYGRALTGISQPYPRSLRFLEDQGNWYTPFDHPGMDGRYDIRGWFAEK
jgi:hypothetical protein